MRTKIICLSLLFLGVIFNQLFSQCNQPLHPDYNALIKFYESTKGSSWKNNSGWKQGLEGTNCDPCNGWFGITCNQIGRVVKLELIDNNLQGKINKEFVELEHLESIDLRTNKLNGSFPVEFCNLPKLNNLNLFRNSFTGVLPVDIGKMKSLKSMTLTLNSFSGIVPNEISLMTSLQSLNLSYNNFSGELLNKLTILPEIASVALIKNNFTGTIPVDLIIKPKMYDIRLSFNKFSGIIPGEVGRYLNLFLDNNNFEGCLSQELYQLCSRTNRDLSNNPLLPWKGDLVEYCKTSGDPLEQIGAPCKNPKYAFNQTIDGNCNCVPDCKHPDFLPLIDFYNSTYGSNWIKKNGWVSDVSASCDPCNWFGITCDTSGRVTEIRLLENRLKGQIPQTINGLTKLKKLVLGNNDISFLPETIGDLNELVELNISNNKINKIPSSLGKLSNLEILKLSYNQITGEIPNHLTNLSKLKILDFFSNQLTGNLPKDFTNLVSLEELYLTANRINGELPADIDKLSNLKKIRLESNKFLGKIPSNISKLNNLEFAWLEYNNFEGCFSQELNKFCINPNTFRTNGNANLSWGGDFEKFCENGGNEEQQNGAFCGFGGTILDCECIPSNEACYSAEDILCKEWLHDTLSNRQCYMDQISSQSYSVLFSTYLDSPVIVINTGYVAWSEVGNIIEIFNCGGKLLEKCNYTLGINCGDTATIYSKLQFPPVSIFNCNYDTLPGDCTFRKHPDYNNLISIYNATNGNNWTNNNGWKNGLIDTLSNPCGWQGIYCNDLNRVNKIILNNQNLLGIIPNEIFEIPHIEVLDLRNNYLNGNLPSVLQEPKYMRELNVSGNLIEGNIPNYFSKWKKLTLLDLSDNKLTGCIDEEMKQLCQETVNLSGNGSLPWLGDFNMFCNTDGSIPSQFGSPCDDNNINTINDSIQPNCNCEGLIINNQNEIISKVFISPNPASNSVSVNSRSELIHNVIIFDLNGRIVADQKQHQNSVIIDVSDLKSGSYILKSYTQNSVFVFKLLKR